MDIIKTAATGRRDFLRKLTLLPLIGGGVSLIGRPTAAAAPVTEALMKRYVDFLSRELMTASAELDVVRCPWRHFGPQRHEAWDLADYRTFIDRTACVTFVCDEGPATAAVAAAPPSTRAAVLLSAAGVPLPA